MPHTLVEVPPEVEEEQGLTEIRISTAEVAITSVCRKLNDTFRTLRTLVRKLLASSLSFRLSLPTGDVPPVIVVVTVLTP
jgi:hypothetical protein